MSTLGNAFVLLFMFWNRRELKLMSSRFNELALDATPLPDTIREWFGG